MLLGAAQVLKLKIGEEHFMSRIKFFSLGIFPPGKTFHQNMGVYSAPKW